MRTRTMVAVSSATFLSALTCVTPAWAQASASQAADGVRERSAAAPAGRPQTLLALPRTATVTARPFNFSMDPAGGIHFTQTPPAAATPAGTVGTGTGAGSPGTDCEQTSSHTDAAFSGGSYIAQLGFAERESLAASYTIPASAFPIRINRTNFIFVNPGTSVATTTQWTILFFEGTPDTGRLVASYSSDDVVLPHIKLAAGFTGVNVEFSIDPTDPEQVIIENRSGTNTFTIAVRVDKHNNQTQNPCFFAPPRERNAFPVVDTSGLSSATGNWLQAVDCGIFGCRAGWSRFSQLGACRPSGDWVLKTAWQPVLCQPGVGACCKPDGNCEQSTPALCAGLGGIYRGDGVTCAAAMCPQPSGACCIPATGGCAVVTASTCTALAGSFRGPGSTCAACAAPACYANCNGDTTPAGRPLLDIQDFVCFQNRFALADTYANCNGDTTPTGAPLLDIQDFTCFQNRFAIGCP